MFCTNCGSKVYDDASFCTICGAKIHNIQNVQVTEGAIFAYQEAVNREEQLLDKFLKRVRVGGVLWFLIGVSQLYYVVSSLFGDSVTGAKTAIVTVILGICNMLNGLGNLLSKEDMYENRMHIVEENQVKGNVKWYIWNGIVGVCCLITGDYFFGLLVIAAVVVDLVFIKMYVAIHKKEFLQMEIEQQ